MPISAAIANVGPTRSNGSISDSTAMDAAMIPIATAMPIIVPLMLWAFSVALAIPITRRAKTPTAATPLAKAPSSMSDSKATTAPIMPIATAIDIRVADTPLRSLPPANLVAATSPTIIPPSAARPTPALSISPHSILAMSLAAITKRSIPADIDRSVLPISAIFFLPISFVAAVRPTIIPARASRPVPALAISLQSIPAMSLAAITRMRMAPAIEISILPIFSKPVLMLPFSVLAISFVAAMRPTMMPAKTTKPVPALAISLHSIPAMSLAATTIISIAVAIPTNILPTVSTSLVTLPAVVLAINRVAARSPTITPARTVIPAPALIRAPSSISPIIFAAMAMIIIEPAIANRPSAILLKSITVALSARGFLLEPSLFTTTNSAPIIPASAPITPTAAHILPGSSSVSTTMEPTRIAIEIASCLNAMAFRELETALPRRLTVLPKIFTTSAAFSRMSPIPSKTFAKEPIPFAIDAAKATMAIEPAVANILLKLTFFKKFETAEPTLSNILLNSMLLKKFTIPVTNSPRIFHTEPAAFSKPSRKPATTNPAIAKKTVEGE